VNRESKSKSTSLEPGRPTPRWAVRLAVFGLTCAARVATADEASELAHLPAPGTTPARLEWRVPASYPPHLRERGVAGVVIVSARVGRDGRIRETRIEHSVPDLDEAARAVAGRYEFTPARAPGEAGSGSGDDVESWVLIPVRYDASLPTGARGSEPVAAARYPDTERSFESDVAVLQQSEPSAPSVEDAELRRRIMSGSLLLEVMPPPGIEAVHALLQGDSLAQATTPEVRERRRERWLLAAHLAPWWPLPYRRLTAVAIADRELGMAQRCADILLAGRPGDEWALAMRRRARQIELAEGSERDGGSKKK